jgi:hypothetical protein
MPAAFRMAEHPPGPCMVLDTLRSFYGKKLGDWILWERTCFPMSDAHALYQARLLIEKDQEPSVLKVLQGCLAS